MTIENKIYGSFTVTGDSFRITDPCYDLNTIGGITLDNIKQGIWTAVATVIDQNNGWGKRVAALKVVHESWPLEVPNTEYDHRAITVDSGQAGFYDILKYPDKNSQQREEFYDINCDLTLSEEHGGTVQDIGAVSSSGYGDGIYSVYYNKNIEGKIVSAEIVFIDDEDSEDGTI